MDKTGAVIENIESIGSTFVSKYFDALAGKPNSMMLRKFFNEKSIYVFSQHGRLDQEMHGLYLIEWFVKRMKYSECTVTVRSVNTVARAHPTEFTVSSICELLRPENNVPFNFVQTFVIKRVPWTQTDFQIVETQSKFEDEIEDDFLPKVVSVPIIACTNVASKKIKSTNYILWLSPADKGTTVGDELIKSSLKRTNMSNKTINLEAVDDKEVAGKSEIISTSTDCNGNLKNANKKTTTCSIYSSSPIVQKSTNKKLDAVDSKLSNKLNRGRGLVSKKVAGNPMTEMQFTVKNTPNVQQNLFKKQTTEKKIVSPKKLKNNNEQSIKPKILARVDKNTFISTNRFGPLAVDYESDSSSTILNTEDDTKNPSTNSLENVIWKSKKSRKSPAAIQKPMEQPIATKNLTTKKSKKNNLSVDTELLAKRNKTIVRKADMKTSVIVNEGRRDSSTKNSNVPGVCVDIEVIHKSLSVERFVTVQQEHKCNIDGFDLVHRIRKAVANGGATRPYYPSLGKGGHLKVQID